MQFLRLLGAAPSTAFEQASANYGRSPNREDRRFDPPPDLSPVWAAMQQLPPYRGSTDLPRDAAPPAVQAGLGVANNGTYYGDPGVGPILEGANLRQVSPLNLPMDGTQQALLRLLLGGR